MSTEFWDISGNLLENVFEPALGNNGVSDPNYFDINHVPLVFCALSFGTAAENTGYGRTGGVGDLNTLWAKKGSVSYLVNPSTYNGSMGHAPCEAVTWADELYASAVLNLFSNGTWNIEIVTTNYKTDNVPAYGSQFIYDYSNGLVLATGNWAQHPATGVGNNYSVNATSSGFVSGWINYPVVPPSSTNVVYNPGSFRGPGTALVNSPTGAGNGQSLANTVSIGLVLQGQGTSGNSSYADNNGGLSWYSQCMFDVVIYNTANPSVQISAVISFANELRWQQTSYTPPPAPSPTPTPSPGGGGGGGGCVATTMFLQPGLLAGNVTEGRIIDGVGYQPDRVVSRLVEAVDFSIQPCLRLVTESDIEVIASESTPMTMPDGSLKMFPDMLGEWVLVDDNGDVHWEIVKELEPVGDMMVALISMSNQNYFAGTVSNRRVGTHNVIAVK